MSDRHLREGIPSLRTRRGRGGDLRARTFGGGRFALAGSAELLAVAGFGSSRASAAGCFGACFDAGATVGFGGDTLGAGCAFLSARPARRLFSASMKSSSWPFGCGASGGAGTATGAGSGFTDNGSVFSAPGVPGLWARGG